MNPRSDIALYGKLAALKLGYVAGQIEVTSKCFQHCAHCESWKHPMGEFTLEKMQEFFCHLYTDFPFFEHLTLTGGDPQAWEPLEKFLLWKFHSNRKRIKLQVSTALARDINNSTGWLYAVDDLRVSLDTISAHTYRRLRGDDKKNRPIDIIERTKKLAHPNLAFIVTVYPETVHEIFPLLEYLNNEFKKGLKIRRIIIMIGIDVDLGPGHYFWDRWDATAKAAENIDLPTSFADSITMVRAYCNSKTALEIPCYASKLGFHIKANGSVYPCCLTGGEAIKVRDDSCMGNIHKSLLKEVYEENKKMSYCYKDKPDCRKICQYKQVMINMVGYQASKNILAIP